MTLFKKVFANPESPTSERPIRTSYDLAMAPEPEDVVAMDALSEMFSEENEQLKPNDQNQDLPSAEAVAEAQSLLSAAQEKRPLASESATEGSRNKTRILGFNSIPDEALDPIKAASDQIPAENQKFPVGWLVVTEGGGRGAHFALYSGVVSIGRNASQGVTLDFGDTSISRENHAAIAFDEEQKGFFVGHGGKSNIIRLNGQPVLSTEAIKHGDTLRIGETSLRLVALCDENFQWAG